MFAFNSVGFWPPLGVILLWFSGDLGMIPGWFLDPFLMIFWIWGWILDGSWMILGWNHPTKPNKTIQQDKTKRNETEQNKTTQNKTRKGKAKQSKAKQNKLIFLAGKVFMNF